MARNKSLLIAVAAGSFLAVIVAGCGQKSEPAASEPSKSKSIAPLDADKARIAALDDLCRSTYEAMESCQKLEDMIEDRSSDAWKNNRDRYRKMIDEYVERASEFRMILQKHPEWGGTYGTRPWATMSTPFKRNP